MRARRRPHPWASRPHPLVWSLRVVMLLFVAAIAAGSGAAVGGLLGYLNKVPPLEELEHYEPPQTTRVYDRSGREVVAEFADENRLLLPLAEMPWALPDAFIAIEDRRFRASTDDPLAGHFGVDLKGILRAAVANTRAGRATQGGSTISQQLARNVLRRRVGSARTFERKFRELFVALQIERHYSKDQILEFYLNHIFLGYNSYGVQSAAHTYFGKDARRLTVAECASLAAIPKAPSRINPFANPEKLVERRNIVLNKMRELGMIDAETAARERAAPLRTRPGQGRGRSNRAPYFVDYLRRYLVGLPDIEGDLLDREGYEIQATIQPRYQQIVEEELAQGLKEVERKWQEAKTGYKSRLDYERQALTEEFGDTRPRAGHRRLARIVERRPDGVAVEIGGYRGFAPFRKKQTRGGGDHGAGLEPEYVLPWFDPDLVLAEGAYIDVEIKDVNTATREMEVALYDRKHVQGAAVLLDVETGQILALAGGADYFDMENDGMWDRASRAGRQPGSSFKPLLYAAALEEGYTAGSVLMDDRVEYGGGIYTPRNYSNRYYGPTTLFKALSKSNNVVTVKLFDQLGLSTTFRHYRRFDIVEPRPQWTLKPELATCLGSLEATPLSMAAAYLPFARRGLGIEPLCATRIGRQTDAGMVYETLRPRERRVLSPQTAYIVTAMLRDVVRHGTAADSIGQHFQQPGDPEIAGKTGTTSDCVDAWFTGYTPQLVLAVWVGFDRNRSLGPRMTGSYVAAPIWRGILRRVLATRQDWQQSFDVPRDIVFRDIGSRTGMLASEFPMGDEQTIPRVPFRRGSEPTQPSQGYAGFPYWRHQHPDPEKNEIESPEAVPYQLLAEYQSSQYWGEEPLQTGPVGRSEPALPDPEALRSGRWRGDPADLAPRAGSPEDQEAEWLLAPPWDF